MFVYKKYIYTFVKILLVMAKKLNKVDQAAWDFYSAHNKGKRTSSIPKTMNAWHEHLFAIKKEEIKQFLYDEITERRPYSSSKMCEEVIKFIEKI